MINPNNPQKLKDLKFGEEGEKNIYESINSHLNINAIKTHKYCNFDMEDENNLIEIKSRRYKLNRFDAFFFSHHKLKYAEGKNKHIWIVFNLLDGCYCKMVFCPTKYLERIQNI